MRKLIDDCKETIDELPITTMNDIVIGAVKLSIKVYEEKYGKETVKAGVIVGPAAKPKAQARDRCNK